MAPQLSKCNTLNVQFLVCIIVYSLFSPMVLGQSRPPTGVPVNTPNPNSLTATTSLNSTITFGGKNVPLLDTSFCETHRRGRNFTSFTLMSELQKDGFNFGPLSGACEVKIQSLKTRDDIKGVTEKFNAEDSSKSKEILLNGVKTTLTQLEWKQSLFFFQITCPSQSICFRRVIRDDTDPEFNNWVKALDAKVGPFLKTLPPPKFSPNRDASGNPLTLYNRYTELKQEYLNNESDGKALTKYVNILLRGDTLMGSKRFKQN